MQNSSRRILYGAAFALFGIAIWQTAFGGLRQAQKNQAKQGPVTAISLKDLHAYDDFRAAAYLDVAQRLQALGAEEGKKKLHELVFETDGKRKKGVEGHPLIALCRMLFVARPGKEFRRPRIGKPIFIGGEGSGPFPMEPIHIVNGVPFFVVSTYFAPSGFFEGGEDYLEYCVANCDWNPFPFKAMALAERQAALKQLLRTVDWAETFTIRDWKSLSRQVEGPSQDFRE